MAEYYIDKALSQFTVQYRNRMPYIALKALPPVQVKQSSGKYFVFKKFPFLSEPNELRRASDADYRRLTMGMADPGTYSCVEYGAEILLPDSERDNADSQVRLEQNKVRVITEALNIAQERRVASLLFNTSNFTNKSSLSGTSRWDDDASDPYGDVNTAINTIAKEIGIKPNVMIVGQEVWSALQKHPDIIDRVKYTMTALASDITPAMVARALGLENILVGATVYNTADEGQAVSTAYIWGKYALIAYVEPKPSLESVSLGYTIMRQDTKVARYREESKRATVFQIYHEVDEKLVCEKAGYLYSTVVS